MSVTAEELEIVIKANVTDAIKKLEGLKGQIQKTMSKTVQPMQKVNTQVAKSMTTTMNQTSKAMSILSREIEMQERKVESLKKKYQASFQSKSKSMVQDFRNQQKAQIQLDKMKLRYEQMGTKTIPKVDKATRKATKSTNMLVKTFKRILVAMAIRTVIKQVQEGMRDLAVYSDRFNDSMSNMQAQLLQLRNSLTVALTPILEGLEPALIRITDLFINLFNTISKYTTALFTNSKTYTIATKVTTDYAKSVGKAKKEQEGMLAGFDELNVITKPEVSGGTEGMPSSEEMFDTLEIDNKTLTMAENIKKAFSEVGTAIKNALNGPINDFVSATLPQVIYTIQNYIIPFFIELGLQVKETLSKGYEVLAPIFNKVWTEGVQPAINLILGLWGSMWQTIYTAWQKHGEKIFDNIRTSLERIGETFTIVWEEYLQPVWQNFMDMVDWLWAEHLQPFVANFADFVAELVNGALSIYNNVIAPITNWLLKILTPIVKMVMNTIVDVVGTAVATILDVASGIITTMKGIIQFISGTLTLDWEKAWEGFRNIFKGIWESFGGIIKGVVNVVIDLINNMLGLVEDGINAIIEMINGLEIVNPFNGEEIWSPNIPLVDFKEIPKLKNGSVLSQETLFIGGEYPGAKTNPEIVSPQSLMYETNVKANIPVINAVEEMSDRLVGALQNIGVYAEFDYSKLKVGLDAEGKRTGKKLYSM